MIRSQPNSLLRRVSLTMRDAGGTLAPGIPFVGADVQASLNGAALAIASGGAPQSVGSGAYYYPATVSDASIWGSLILIVSHTGYLTTIVEEPVTDTGFGYIALNEPSDSRARVFFVIESLDGVPTPGLTPSGSQVKVSDDDGSLATALGAVVEVGGGVYYYQTTIADRSASAGDFLVFVSVDPTNYKDVFARKVVLDVGYPPLAPEPVDTGRPSVDLATIAGADIALVGGDFATTQSGDWALVEGVQCAEQSVVREAIAIPGSFPRRPQWGGGLSGLLFKGQTKATRDEAVARTRACTLRNPRIKKVNEVTTTPLVDGSGFAVSIDADAVDGRVTPQIPVKPVRNQ